jgi:hypothetical protein
MSGSLYLNDISPVTGPSQIDRSSTKHCLDDDMSDVRPAKAIKISSPIPQTDSVGNATPSNTVLNWSNESALFNDDRSRQEAALALLQLSNPTFEPEASTSYTRGSVQQNINGDVFTAAVSLMALRQAAGQAQHMQAEEPSPDANATSMHDRMAYLTHAEGDGTDSEQTLSTSEEEEVHDYSHDQEQRLTDPSVLTPEPSSSLPHLLNLDTGDLIPSANSRFKFEYDSPSGRTFAELNRLFRPAGRPKRWPLDVASVHALPLSYNQLGTKPKPGLTNKLVRQTEKKHSKDV